MNENNCATTPANPIANRIGGVFLHVSSMERSVAWYHRLLGLPARSGVTDKVHELAMGGGSALVLDQHGRDRGLAVEDRPLLMFDSPDVDAAYRHVVRLGIPIEWDIERYPGMAFFTFRDPDGNLLMVCGQPGPDVAEQGNPAAQPGAAADRGAVRYDGGEAWLIADESAYAARITAEGLVLTGRANTEASYAVPLRIETTVRLDKGSLRLRFGAYGQLVFNYGPSDRGGAGEEFYVTHPLANRTFDDPAKGAIPTGEWVRIAWTFEERRMEVRVNGRLFHAQEGYFGGAAGTAGIGCDNGAVTVRSFAVESLAARDTLPRLAVARSDGAADALVPDGSCFPALTPDGLWLARNAEWGCALTETAYAVPFELEAVVRSDARTLLLYGGVSAEVKFHADGTLSFRDPASGQERWSPGAGALGDGFAKIVWRMDADRTTVRVDGELRFEQAGDYAGRSFRLGVGADTGSAVTVKSVAIR